MRDKLRKLAIAGVVVALIGIGSGGGILANRAAFAAPGTPDSTTGFAGCWGTGSGTGLMGGMMGYGMFLDQVTLDKIAKLLGFTTTTDLQTQLREGKSLVELAQGKATEQQLIDIIIAPRKEMMALSVTQGYLTQEQSDRMIQWMESAVKTFVNSKTTAAPGGFGPGIGGMMGGIGGVGSMMGGNGGMMGRNGGMMGGYGRADGARFN